MKIYNPILKGFHPDPSIVRKDDTYYIANSTFEWFPGVQIHESKDLIHWQLITYPLTKVTQLNMRGNCDSGGVWAPDLSYADGKFWLVYSDIKTNMGVFKDCTNYLITAEDIYGPWSEPIKLNGVGFDASLFHDDNGKKYLLQMEWDHREYRSSFNGIKCTEFSVSLQKLIPETAKIIWRGLQDNLIEGPHMYKINNYYYLFCAEGGTAYEHQEVVARSLTIYGEYEGHKRPFLTAKNQVNAPLQKCGHGSLIDTPDGEWYFAHLVGRPWHHKGNNQNWCTLGRETAIQKVNWTIDEWPEIIGGVQGQVIVEAPKSKKSMVLSKDTKLDDFNMPELNKHFNTLRVPFTDEIGKLENSHLVLKGLGSLTNVHSCSLVARRWEAFHFEGSTKMKYYPTTFQQMAGLTNYYNSKHWSLIHVTWNELNGRVIEVTENDNGKYRSFFKEKAISIPKEIEYVYFKTIVEKSHYRYSYSFDGYSWTDIPITLDAAILSDEYVNQHYGGFFTGAFVGMVNMDLSGYGLEAAFDYFQYNERG